MDPGKDQQRHRRRVVSAPAVGAHIEALGVLLPVSRTRRKEATAPDDSGIRNSGPYRRARSSPAEVPARPLAQRGARHSEAHAGTVTAPICELAEKTLGDVP